jgi:hypothetical protein
MVVIGILDQLQKEMRRFLIKLVGKSAIFNQVLILRVNSNKTYMLSALSKSLMLSACCPFDSSTPLRRRISRRCSSASCFETPVAIFGGSNRC